MKLHHAAKINGADHVHIVQNEGVSRPFESSRKKCAAFFRPPPVSSKDLFARDFNPHAEVIIRLQILDNHVSEVMHVDNHVAHVKSAQDARA